MLANANNINRSNRRGGERVSGYFSPEVERILYLQLLYNFQNVKRSAFWSILFFAFNSKWRFMAFF